MKRKGTEQVPEAIPDEMGEFEDAWEDEFEEEEEYAEEHSEEMEDSEGEEEIDEEQDEEMENVPKGKIYMPGQPLNEDEVLVADPTVYDMLHSMNVEWPCLSFDILRDAVSPGYPFTCYLAAGSQADSFDANQIYLMKISNMYKTKQQLSDSESDDDDDALDEDPILEYKTVRHKGSVNRIRAMPHQKSHIIASMSEDSNVYIYDATQLIDSLDTPGLVPQTNPLIHTIKSHRAEGYALDWSRHETGHLLTGDISSKILMTSKTNTGFVTSKEYFSGHESSIEDIQWSQSSLFASCSADKTIRLWDSRMKGKAQFCVKAHDSDVNVIHWNRCSDFLLASGSEGGEFSIWDMRAWSNDMEAEPAATFNWSQAAVSSIEWHPTDSSVLAVSYRDDQTTLWDLSLEEDDVEQTEDQVPPQLLFIHQGQKNVKEIHWHPKMQGVLVTTAYDGINVFKTFNQ